MKNFTVAFLLFALISTGYGQNTYNAIFFAEEGEKFWVILNGVRQNENPETNVQVTGLTFPNYKAKIIFEDKSLGQIDKNLLMPEASSEITYRIKRNRKDELVLRYYSQVALPPQPKQQPNQQVVVYSSTQQYPADPWAGQTTTTTTTTTQTSSGTSENVNMNVNVGGLGMGVNINVNDPGTGQSSTSTTTTTTTSSTMSTTTHQQSPAQPAGSPASANHYKMPGYSGPVGCSWPMNDNDFSSAKKSIDSKSFEDSKLTVAKQICNSNCLTSSQVRDIMMLFSFEDSKLDFAKHAYGYTFDIGNYYKVNDAFDFESSIEELNEYIERR